MILSYRSVNSLYAKKKLQKIFNHENIYDTLTFPFTIMDNVILIPIVE